MKFTTTLAAASLAAVAAAGKDEFSFAVLRFDGDGFMTEGLVDPIVNPGEQAAHYHGVMGGSNFGVTVEGDQLLDSKCTTAKIKNDKSNYWINYLFFQDPNDPSSFEKVDLFYMNVYYFFEPGDQDIEPFPPGLKMLSGNTTLRTPPAAGGKINLDPAQGPINPVQWTCPRSSYNPPSYPADSDGTTAGIQDPQNQGAGTGFPLYPCDGYASPHRQDIHFPSCYNPDVGLDDYENNMAWPENVGGRMSCPDGYIRVPHLFYEVYWKTDAFTDRWTPDGKTQPFVLSNGDATGFSSHGDFLAGWDEDTLRTIINTCNAGTSGMDKCPQIPGGLNDVTDCKIPAPLGNILAASTTFKQLPGNNLVTGWGHGGGSVDSSDSGSSSSSSTYKAGTSTPTPSSGGAFIEQPSSSPTTSPAEAPAVSEASIPESDPNVEVVWDYVTVTQTTTINGEPTPAPVRRRGSRHGHGHAARHVHGGRR
ncbi:hypothetical protein F5X99DRAFT_372979 [Biscogniauxia marginata]|nr:hypothetical protein F5X99DRAFT_372979 [Biscogniauxia marginata]